MPFDYWNGIRPAGAEYVCIPAGTVHSVGHAVGYRGWFINDEVLPDGWKTEPSAVSEMWKRIFETIFRCGVNMVTAGTDRKNDGDELNRLALDMGLCLTQHHSELLGAKMLGREYPDLVPSYDKRPAEFERLWQEAIDQYAGKKVIWPIGYRGQGDKAFGKIKKDLIQTNSAAI